MIDAKTATFVALRQRLLGIAGRVLGVPAEAEEVVQEVYLRFHREPLEALVSAEAWLVTVVTRLAIDRRRERQALERALVALDAARLLSPHPTLAPARGEPGLGPQVEVSEEQRAERRDEAGRALAELQRRLPAYEALVLLLYDVLEADYRDLSGWLGKSEEACRQLVHRARRKLASRAEPPARPQVGPVDTRLWLRALQDRDHRSLVAALLRAAGRPQPAAPAAAAQARAALRFDATGRLALHLGPHLLCSLPVPVLETDQCCA